MMLNTTQQFEKEMVQIIKFAKGRGYDLSKLDSEMMDEIMFEWNKHNLEFYKNFEAQTIETKKEILGL